jgi:polyhydroxybutyrate depolymerase
LRRFAPLLCSLLTVIGCSGETPVGGPAGASTPLRVQAFDGVRATTGCGQPSPARPGSTEPQQVATDPHLEAGRRDRDYLLHLPSSYNSNRPAGVVVALHGYSGDAQGMEQGTGLSTAADRFGFIAVYPDGVMDVDANRYWNSVGNVGKSPDDVLFVSLVLDQLQHSACVDPRRIFVTGFSNGGGMTGVLMCRLSHRIAAFAPVAGNFYRILDGCSTERPVSALEVHGTADDVIPYAGIPPAQEPAYPLPAIPDWLSMWASHDRCAADPSVFLETADAMGERWTGCSDGAEVAHYRIEGGGHAIPASIGGRSFADVLWSFFTAHPLR